MGDLIDPVETHFHQECASRWQPMYEAALHEARMNYVAHQLLHRMNRVMPIVIPSNYVLPIDATACTCIRNWCEGIPDPRLLSSDLL